MQKPPNTWDECAKLARSDDLNAMIEVRLVQLAFAGDNPSVSVKAIEILRSMPRVHSDDVLSEYDTATLMRAQVRALAFLESVREQD